MKKTMTPVELPERMPQNPFDVVPVVTDNVTALAKKGGRLQLSRELPSKPGVGAAITRALGLRKSSHFGLDETGVAYWNLIDGEKTLRAIEEQLRETQHVKQEDNEAAVIAFTAMLMKRGLIQLKIDQSESD